MQQMNGLKPKIGLKCMDKEQVHEWTGSHIRNNSERIKFCHYPTKFIGNKTKGSYRVKRIKKDK